MKRVGFIENFDRKGSYPEFGTKVEVIKPVMVKIMTSKASNIKVIHPITILNKKLLKRAKHDFKVTNPNHVEKLLHSNAI